MLHKGEALRGRRSVDEEATDIAHAYAVAGGVPDPATYHFDIYPYPELTRAATFIQSRRVDDPTGDRQHPAALRGAVHRDITRIERRLAGIRDAVTNGYPAAAVDIDALQLQRTELEGLDLRLTPRPAPSSALRGW